MPVIIRDMSTETIEAAPRAAQPHDAGAPAADSGLTLERLRAAMTRDAQRQARLWAD
jgi:hypothetical protein